MVIKVIIPTHNRLPLLIETLASVINQHVVNPYKMEIVISDNSTNNETEEYFKSNNFKNLSYHKRSTELSVIEHFQLICDEVDSDYFMIFHDDDLMIPGMINKLLNNFDVTSIAIASNAYVLKRSIKTKRLYIRNFYSNRIIRDKQELLSAYISKKNIAPFPGYIYKYTASKVQFDLRFGKHADVYFLSKILEIGPIKILNEPLFYYREHEGQVSYLSDFSAKNILLKYILKECNLSRKDKSVISFRLENIYSEFMTRFSNNRIVTLNNFLFFTLSSLRNMNFLLLIKLYIKTIKYYLAKLKESFASFILV